VTSHLIYVMRAGTEERVYAAYEVTKMLKLLKKTMYTAEGGTWVSFSLMITAVDGLKVDYNYDEKPDFVLEVSAHDYTLELERFPRPEGSVPGWWRELITPGDHSTEIDSQQSKSSTMTAEPRSKIPKPRPGRIPGVDPALVEFASTIETSSATTLVINPSFLMNSHIGRTVLIYNHDDNIEVVGELESFSNDTQTKEEKEFPEEAAERYGDDIATDVKLKGVRFTYLLMDAVHTIRIYGINRLF
jgi:hypothetical protein